MGDGENYASSQQPTGGYGGSSGGAGGYGQSQTPPSPYGATKNPAQQWQDRAIKEFLIYQRQVPGRLTDEDAKQLNVQITASYAKMYLTNTLLFKWAGMAAFASHEVGNGMEQAWRLGFGEAGYTFGPLAVWVGGIATGHGSDAGPIMGKLLFWALTGGNRLVWADIFWQHLAYRDAGLKALQDAGKAGDIPQRVVDAWTLIDTGGKSKNANKVWEGNMALLMYEQQEILQPKIYDAPEVKDLWKAISPDVPSPIPGHNVSFTGYVPGGNIGVFSERWKWISESMLPAWRQLDTNEPDRTKKLIEALK
jgi:hypothetical protein